MLDDLNQLDDSADPTAQDQAGADDPAKPAAATPAVDPGKPDPKKPAPRMPTGAEWAARQSAPVAAQLADDPSKATTTGLGRMPTGAEWQTMQRMSGKQIAQWQIPAVPKFAGTPGPSNVIRPTPEKGFFGELWDDAKDMVVNHPADLLAAPLVAAVAPAVGLAAGTYFGGDALVKLGLAGYQRYLESHASPGARQEMLDDPERISNAAALAQATLLLGPAALHLGAKSIASAADVSGGMMEAGASGVKETNFGPQFSDGFQDATDRSRFAANIEKGAAEATPDAARGVSLIKGLEPNALLPGKRGVSAARVEGLETPAAVKPGKITPIATEDASAPLQQAADVNQSVRDYQQQRAAEDRQDISDAAERLLGLREDDAARVERETTTMIRRRPRFFESPDGANLLGSVAASRGLPDDASPYPPSSPLDDQWKAGHDAVTSAAGASGAPTTASYPDGFSMGGALTDNRIPSDYTPPRLPRGEPTPPVDEAPARVSTVPRPLDTVQGARDVLEQSRAEGERRSLEREAKTDALTGLGNQRAYMEALPDAERDPNTSIIRFDANGFKAVNDRHGHPIGDQTLAEMGHTIREQANGLPVFRVGGDEFAVFAPKDEAESVRDGIEQSVGVRELQGPHFETGEHVTTPYSISGGIGETDAEADAAAKVRKTAQKAEQGIPESRPTTPTASARGLEPIEGAGETRTRGLSQGVQEKALAHRLNMGEVDLPTYERIKVADQARWATRLVADNPELAARIARGEAPAPHGLKPESVFVAVEQRAIAEGDVNTLRDLATSKLTGDATEMGQRIRMLGERDPESPVSAIKDIENTRSGGAANAAKAAKATNAEVDAIDTHLAGVAVTPDAWTKFLDSIKC